MARTRGSVVCNIRYQYPIFILQRPVRVTHHILESLRIIHKRDQIEPVDMMFDRTPIGHVRGNSQLLWSPITEMVAGYYCKDDHEKDDRAY